MKWFKHLSDSHDDEKLASLLSRHGLEAYGLWWFIVEVVAGQIPSDSAKCEVSYPLSYWLRFTGVYHHKKFRMFVQSMADLSLISVTSLDNLCDISSLSTKDLLTISIPNILKFRDEYSKKSGQNPERLRSKKEKEKEIQKEKEITTTATVAQVRELYQQYAGVNVVNGGQVVVFQDLIKGYTLETITEAFQAAASSNISTPGFLTWSIKRMERRRDEPAEESFGDFLSGLAAKSKAEKEAMV